MRLLYCALICSIFLLASCNENKEQKMADQAFAEGKYHKAFTLYKQAIKNEPGEEILYRSLEKTAGYIASDGMAKFGQGKYQECIETLKLLVDDKDYPVNDAGIITSMAYFYGFHKDTSKIADGFKVFYESLKRSKQQFALSGFPNKTVEWLEKQGLKKDDILTNQFSQRDLGFVWRAFFYYNIVNQAIGNKQNFNHFPIPESWSKQEQDHAKMSFALLDWFVHNIAVVSKDDPRYYPTIVSQALMRGYGSSKEAASAFVFLALQRNIPAYVFRPKDSDAYFVLVNIGKRWVLIDLEAGSPILEKNNKIPLDFVDLLKDKSWSYGDCKQSQMLAGTIFVTVPPRSITPRLSLFTKVFQKYNVQPPPYLYIDILSLAQHADKLVAKMNKQSDEETKKLPTTTDDSYLDVDPDKLCVAYYADDFKAWSAFQEIKNTEDHKKTIIRDTKTRTMRLKYLQGLFEEVNKEAEKLKGTSEYEQFFQALATFYDGKNDEALEQLNKCLKNYPNSIWKKNIYTTIAKVYIMKKDFAKAKEYYQKSGMKQQTIDFFVE